MKFYKSIFSTDPNNYDIIIYDKINIIKVSESSLTFYFGNEQFVNWLYDNNNDRDKELKTFLMQQKGSELNV